MNDLSPNTIVPEATTGHVSIFKALAAAQQQMGPALKESTNPAFRSKYADLANVMAACLPALNANGIAVFQPPVEIDGARYVKTILAHESGEMIECAVPLIVGKNDMQGYGSAVTYARRYGLMAMAGIAPDDDDGNAVAQAAPVVEDRRPARQDPSKQEAHKMERNPQAIRDWLLDYIKRANKAADLDALNTDGSKSATAWQWLEDEHKDEAVKVKKAFDARKSALTDEIPY